MCCLPLPTHSALPWQLQHSSLISLSTVYIAHILFFFTLGGTGETGSQVALADFKLLWYFE